MRLCSILFIQMKKNPFLLWKTFISSHFLKGLERLLEKIKNDGMSVAFHHSSTGPVIENGTCISYSNVDSAIDDFEWSMLSSRTKTSPARFWWPLEVLRERKEGEKKKKKSGGSLNCFPLFCALYFFLWLFIFKLSLRLMFHLAFHTSLSHKWTITAINHWTNRDLCKPWKVRRFM